MSEPEYIHTLVATVGGQATGRYLYARPIATTKYSYQ